MATFVLAGALAGCAGSDAGRTLTSALNTTPPAGTIMAATTVVTLGNSPSVAGSPTTVYERVARGALTCWFGGLGPLKKTHIFNADAAPPSAGGAAEIMVHERDANPLPNQSPRGARAFRIWFERESETTTRVRMEGNRLPADLADAMQTDAVAWATERSSCAAQVVRPPPAVEPEPVKVKAKKRAQPPRRV